MRRAGIAALLAVLVVVAWWVVGFLPWFSVGLDWPKALATPVGSSTEGLAGLRMPLPLIASYLPVLVCCALIGGTVAGMLPILVLQARLPRPAAIGEVWLVTGVVVAVTLLVSVRQIRAAVGDGFAADHRVLTGLEVAVAVATVLGLVIGSVSVHWHGFTSLAAALVAGSATTWVHAFLYDGIHGSSAQLWADRFADMLVAAVMLAGLLVSVHRSRRWVLLWPVALAVLWCSRPAVAALGYLAGMLRPSSGLPQALPDHFAAARQVFVEALRHTHPQLWPLVVAFGGAMVWLVAGSLFRRSGGLPPVA